MKIGGDSWIMMGDPGDDFQSPKRGGYTGAEIVKEPEDQFYGDRRYDAKDPEGHFWTFAQRVKEMAPEDWGATTPG